MIAFFHVGHQPWAKLMVESAKSCMDGRIVQLSDHRTAAVPGVDEIIRLPWDGKHMMLFRIEHLRQLKGEFITCDADVIFKKSVLDVWDDPFDVALTFRNHPISLTKDHEGLSKGDDVAKDMPINTGLIFSRSTQFWQEVYSILEKMPESMLNWWGDQKAIFEASKSFSVKRLECDEFNWTPSTKDEYNGARVVHYKGIRKKWLTHGTNNQL